MRISLSLFCFSLILFVSCSVDKGDESSNQGNTPLDLEITSSTDSRGMAKVNFQTPSDATKVMISAKSKGGYDLAFTKVDGGGEDYLNPDGERVSLSGTFTTLINVVNIPSRGVDPQLTSATSFNVEVEVDLSDARNESDDVTFNITSREDSNLNAGGLTLNIFYVGDIGTADETKSAMKAAFAEAKDIMSDSASIGLDIVEFDIQGPVTLPAPFNGNSLYLSATSMASSPSVNLFVGGDIGGVSSPGEVLGLSSSIPGPALASEKSVVAVSIFASAGRDGVFDSEDIRILGETIAHESAHFMGLFHPVDFNGSLVGSTDPLSDTDSCSFLTDCISRESLITNLMFPSPVADKDGDFVRQNKLTSEQRGVLNRYIAVR